MEKKTPMDNSAELKDLVYAPLRAISEANIRLSSSIVDFIASTGDLNSDTTGKPVVQLRTIQMLYEQLRSDELNNTVSDNIGLEIPLLSIFPLSCLKVAKTKVAFDAEIKSMKTTEEDVKIYTQVCSKNQRDGANQGRISYEVELDSSPISEGLARFIDTLNTQSIPKLIHSKPVDNAGRKLSGKELEDYERQRGLKQREMELNTRLSEVKELIRNKNNSLRQETGMSYEEYTEQLAGRAEGEEAPEPPESYRTIQEYQAIGADLECQLDAVRKEMIIARVGTDTAAGESGG